VKSVKYYEKVGLVGMLGSIMMLFFTSSVIIPTLTFFDYVISTEVIMLSLGPSVFFLTSFFIFAYMYLNPKKWLDAKKRRVNREK